MTNNKRVLVTGGFGNLGSAVSKLFAATEWEVDSVSRRVGINLRDWDVVTDYITSRSAYDLVVMAHGTQKKLPVADYNAADMSIVHNNLTSAIILSSVLVKTKSLRPGALVVYCSSIQASQPREGRGLYAIAKSGIEALARIMAVELAPDVRAIALRLGQMTAQMDGMIFPESERQKIESRIPLPWVSFDDTARFIQALYNQPSISGEVIEISSMHKFSIWPE